jgi:hypothetical protein
VRGGPNSLHSEQSLETPQRQKYFPGNGMGNSLRASGGFFPTERMGICIESVFSISLAEAAWVASKSTLEASGV